MTKIVCPCIDCKYNSDKNICEAKNIKLKYRNTITMYYGRVNMWICDKYEISEEYEEMTKDFKEWLSKEWGKYD